MKFYCLFPIYYGLLVSAAFAQKGQSPYTFNRVPLKQDVYAQLPLGNIKAKGWLLKQLELQKDGFTGHAEELYAEDDNLGSNSDWLGGTGNSWEKVPYYVKGLVALAYTLDDIELKAKARKWIDYTLNHQQENGLFGPPKMKDWWPRMPFMYALQSYYEATNDKRVIPFLSKYFKYELNNLDKDPLKEWGKSRAGDNMEIALWVYNKTGDAYLLDLVNKLKQQAYPWADIFNQNQFQFYGPDYQPKHMVNVSEALKFPAVYSQVDPSPYYTDAMQNGIKHILDDNGQPTGIGSGTEFMSGHNTVEGVETCAVVEWMQSLETGARIIHINSSIGDQLEKLAFNTLPAQFSNDLKNHTYYTLPNQVQNLPGSHGFNQDYGNGIVPSPFSGFPCCRYNMHMGWPYFVKNSWVATPDGGLAVNAYAPMEVNAIVAQNIPVKIDEVTNYPFDEQIDLNFTLTKVASFGLKLRIPSWCAKPEVKLNGKQLTGVVAGKILTLKRTWKSGDKITLNFPMQVVVKPQVSNAVSVERGPLVYAIKIKESVKNVREYPVKGFYETEITPASAWNYGLVLDANTLAKNITVVKSAMPDNPFVQGEVPVQLKVSAKQIPAWTIDNNHTAAFDVPYSPVASTEPTEQITLVPYGSESLRVSIIPIIGKPAYNTTAYKQTFDYNTATGLINYGNGWFYKDNAIHTGANDNGLSGTNGPKIIATGTQFRNFIYTADVAVNTAGDAGLMFRVAKPAIGADAYEGYYVGINVETGSVTLGKSSNNKWIEIATTKYPLKIKDTYKVKIKAVGNQFEVFLNGTDKPLITATDDEYKTGNIGLRVYNAIATMDNLEVKALPGRN
ncbi:beta-L-arabinofuranosidase domain-containing protein [Mucilaginibacter sp. UYCu711]|uniref:beta-L-arabinofuranosidase domain-containing protein n=1 Tax=Mucilaginibacter sp. UYCu711 TaxID=3156339 RepID=UPI003D20EEAF